MSNSNNNNNQRRNILSGASLVVGAVGVLAGLAAAEHVQAQEENRESVVQGIGRWLRENVLDMPSGGTSASASGSASRSWSAYEGAPRRLSHAEVNILPVRRIERAPPADATATDEDAQTQAQTQGEDQDGTRQLDQTTGRALVERDEKAFCVVCREHYEGGDVLMRLPCFHEFHEECIREYLETSEGPVCPICRHPVTVNLSTYNSYG